MRDAVDLAATVTAGIPTACVDAPSTAADGNDRFAADEGTETQLRATAPATSSALTLVAPPVAYAGSLVGGVELSGRAREVQSTVSGGQGSMGTPTLDDAPRAQHMARGTGMAEDSHVREHLKLGMTLETCNKVLLEIGVQVLDEERNRRWCDSTWHPSGQHEPYLVQLAAAVERLTQLRSSYLDQDRWIAKAYPKMLTGYDVAAATRAYNSRQVEQMRSWCERKLSLNEVEEVIWHKNVWQTRSVGPADVFISHTQADHPSTVMDAMEAANKQESVILRGVKRGTLLRFWVDLFSLRQSTTDFDLDEVLRLVKEVGLTLAIISKAEDAKDMYFARSFCLVEAYGTLVSKAEFVVLVLVLEPHSRPDKYKHERLFGLAEGSHKLGYDLVVNSRAAHCRDAKAGELINRFIEQRIGFAKFDRLLLAGVKQSFTQAAIYRHRDQCCYLGRFCAPSLESFNAHLERRSDCWTNDAFEIRTCLMGHATFEMGSCCKYECCPRHGCCGRCCEMLIVVGCCNGCCVWGGLSESVAALCCFFLCCPTQYQDEDVRNVGELCVRCARCWSPWNVERLLGVHNCRNVLGCWAYDERLDCICHCGGDGCPQSCCCGAESVCAPRVQLHDREKQEMEELAKRKNESKSKMSKEDEARLQELKRLQKKPALEPRFVIYCDD